MLSGELFVNSESLLVEEDEVAGEVLDAFVEVVEAAEPDVLLVVFVWPDMLRAFLANFRMLLAEFALKVTILLLDEMKIKNFY